MIRPIRPIYSILLLLLLVPAAVFAATLVTSSVDGGGGRSGSGACTNDAVIGAIGGIATVTDTTVRHGYAGQLAEAVSLVATGVPAQINQGATSQLSGTATLNDDTVTPLSGAEIAWGNVFYPFQAVDGNGLLTAVTHVYSVASGNVNGHYSDASGVATVQVLGPYAASTIPDWWFIQYFGPAPNPAAAPDNDATGTGQNNLFKYVAGLDPTNAASVFRLRIERVDGQPNQKNLVFSPRWPDRIYTPMYRTNLLSGTWQVLSATNVTDNGTERTVTDLNATESNKFYRIQINLP